MSVYTTNSYRDTFVAWVVRKGHISIQTGPHHHQQQTCMFNLEISQHKEASPPESTYKQILRLKDNFNWTCLAMNCFYYRTSICDIIVYAFCDGSLCSICEIVGFLQLIHSLKLDHHAQTLFNLQTVQISIRMFQFFLLIPFCHTGVAALVVIPVFWYIWTLSINNY